MSKKRRGFIEAIVPVAIGLAIALIIIVSVAIPAVNASIYNGTETTFTGTTGTITGNFLPLIALIALVIVGATIMGVMGRRE